MEEVVAPLRALGRKLRETLLSEGLAERMKKIGGRRESKRKI